MKWLRKWSYLILLIMVGIVYFSYADGWKVYAKALTPVVTIAGKLDIGNLFDWSGEGDAKSDGGVDNAGLAESESETENVEQPGTGGDAEEAGNPENAGQIVSDGNGEGAGATPTDGGNQPDNGEYPDGSMEGTTKPGYTGGTNSIIGGMESDIEMCFGVEEGKQPEYHTVKDLYFADAVFIGDSRTVGMFEYGGLEEITTFYAGRGLSVYDVFDKKIVEVEGQKKKITVEEALQQNSFSKIYLMLGLNEMGTGTTETFLEKYGEVLARLQELQPDAIIYVQAIMKITTERSGKGDQFHNEGIEERNQGLSRFADNEKIFYLDVNPLICDETGGMIEDYTYDGIHLKAKYIEIWKEFLKEHAIIP